MGSIHNELTGRSGFIARALRNALQVESAEVGVERLSETLGPIFDLWSWHRPELALLRGERLWGVAPSQPAVAAEFSQVGISNPAGSGLIVVIEALHSDMPGTPEGMEIVLGAPNVAFTATSTPNSRDSRTALLTGIQCVSFTNHAAARIGSGALVGFLAITSGQQNYTPVNIVLAPGSFIAVGPNQVNRAAQVQFWGYERPAFAGELTARA